jgi:endonuclease/exonuclease/phosphatase family metal-dependent hydrolase
MRPVRTVVWSFAAVCLFAGPAWGQQKVRVATYNIRFLNVGIPDGRAERLKQVLSKLDADVIGLQEIDDRAALERIFEKTQWQLVIDDESNDSQDLAVAVRKPFKVARLDGDAANGLNAGDGDFLFPSGGDDSSFPRRRDVLCVEVAIPNTTRTFFILVHHAKARVGGRAATEQRRIGAARKILSVLEARFDEKDFVLLGDFNDNGDDRSLNILETGDPNAVAAMEETDGPFLANLCEPLLKKGYVSHGRRESDIINGRVDLRDLLSRTRNFNALGTNTNTGDILFENILIPVGMKSRCPLATAVILDEPDGVRGPESLRASDHLPVYIDLSYEETGTDPDEPADSTGGVKIAALLPNPEGEDAGNEWVEIVNGTGSEIDLSGWQLRDRGGNTFILSGTVTAGSNHRIPLPAGKLPLNNSGDDVALLDPAGTVRHRVTYTAAQARPGMKVTFE